jgi:hypothetical protein
MPKDEHKKEIRVMSRVIGTKSLPNKSSNKHFPAVGKTIEKLPIDQPIGKTSIWKSVAVNGEQILSNEKKGNVEKSLDKNVPEKTPFIGKFDVQKLSSLSSGSCMISAIPTMKQNPEKVAICKEGKTIKIFKIIDETDVSNVE